jgi:hydroxypyruvate isomerase
LAHKSVFVGVEFAFPYHLDADELAKEKDRLGLKQVLINAFPGE